ncbi:MAG: EAL domain-containing protein [Alphaproteobacteria bacterium]
MARKPNKRKTRSGKYGTVAPGILFLVACAFAAYVALSSTLIGIFYAGFSLVCVLLYNESRQRLQAQRETGFKIKSLEDNNRFFTGETTRTRHDIVNIQGRLKDLEMKKRPVQTAAAQEKTPPASLPRTTRKNSPVQDNFSNKFLTMLKRSTMPRATKPGVQISSAKPAANDRSEDDMGLSDLVVEELLHHAVTQENINTFLQPIMKLPQRRVEYYEMYARIRAQPGVYMPAARYLEIAHQGNLVSQIDAILLEETTKIILGTAHMNKAAPFFMNITGASLKNKNFMNTLLLFLARNRALAGRLILEMPQSEFEILSAPMRKVMKALGQLGCAFSLDHVENLNIDEEALKAVNIRFIKIRAQTFIARAQKDTEFAYLRHMRNRLDKAGIQIIAEKIESDKTLLELADYDIRYGQGNALAKPDLQSVFESQARERA